ncbi:hypothetical protein ACIA74_27085 [Streptomyces sp. NPDC051658]|uniref:hypothetical protein n=1 Tax=Streptomyces sp. NPDC051658 TaxID=3365667 RepID=UPI0037A0F7A9
MALVPESPAKAPVLLTNLASVPVGCAMYAMSLTLPQLLQSPEATGYGLGRSTLAAGLAPTPGGLVMMTLSPSPPVSPRSSVLHSPSPSRAPPAEQDAGTDRARPRAATGKH